MTPFIIAALAVHIVVMIGIKINLATTYHKSKGTFFVMAWFWELFFVFGALTLSVRFIWFILKNIPVLIRDTRDVLMSMVTEIWGAD